MDVRYLAQGQVGIVGHIYFRKNSSQSIRLLLICIYSRKRQPLYIRDFLLRVKLTLLLEMKTCDRASLSDYLYRYVGNFACVYVYV